MMISSFGLFSLCGLIYLFLFTLFSPMSIRSPPHNFPQQETRIQSYARSLLSTSGESKSECRDDIWCSVPMPLFSHFAGFDPPTDMIRWKAAQILASAGEQVFLRRIRQHIDHPLDFLDGDKTFRKIHSLVDIFIDAKKQLGDLDHLTPEGPQYKQPRLNLLDIYKGKSTRVETLTQEARRLQEEESKDGYINAAKYIPPVYDFRAADRSPVVQIGYGVFKRSGGTYFAGSHIGYNGIKMEHFLKSWSKIKDRIDVPFIAVCQGNENWGCLSTMFPNRTAKWGSCCSQDRYRLLNDFLNHNKTLMFVVNQHHNMTHPKVITHPRGLPITWVHTESIVYDTMKYAESNIKKSVLLFASGSTWGPRPQILRCISSRMSPADFLGHVDAPVNPVSDAKDAMKTDRKLYYRKLAAARFGLALPGLGYDCFRTWELLTMGTVIVIERGVGLDRSLWRLPALLVEDFSEINPDLLRSAYVEAVYRADEFEFQRLKQSYWWKVITDVSRSKSSQPLLDAFPIEGTNPGFTRPKVPFACAMTGQCGPGTKMTPKQSC